jgi:hypothetical protein
LPVIDFPKRPASVASMPSLASSYKSVPHPYNVHPDLFEKMFYEKSEDVSHPFNVSLSKYDGKVVNDDYRTPAGSVDDESEFSPADSDEPPSVDSADELVPEQLKELSKEELLKLLTERHPSKIPSVIKPLPRNEALARLCSLFFAVNLTTGFSPFVH